MGVNKGKVEGRKEGRKEGGKEGGREGKGGKLCTVGEGWETIGAGCDIT